MKSICPHHLKAFNVRKKVNFKYLISILLFLFEFLERFSWWAKVEPERRACVRLSLPIVGYIYLIDINIKTMILKTYCGLKYRFIHFMGILTILDIARDTSRLGKQEFTNKLKILRVSSSNPCWKITNSLIIISTVMWSIFNPYYINKFEIWRSNNGSGTRPCQVSRKYGAASLGLRRFVVDKMLFLKPSSIWC